MLSYFIKRRNGFITIFISVILIAVISLSSLLVEVGRKRSLDSFFKEVMEKSSFSVLSTYDRDLYKRFGLMAMNPQIDHDTLEKLMDKTLKANLNYQINDDGVTGIALDYPIELKNVTVESIYGLGDTAVLRSQIAEVSKYRSPYSVAENTLNLENSLKDFVGSIEKTIPVLSFIKDVTEIGKGIVDTINKFYDYRDASDEFENSEKEYKDEVSRYNKAVEAYDDAVSKLDSKSSSYDDDLKDLKKTMSDAADALKTDIGDLQSKIDDYINSRNDFQSAVEGVLDGTVNTAVRKRASDELKMVGLANDQNNLGVTGYANWSQLERDEYDKMLTKVKDADDSKNFGDVIKDLQDYLKKEKASPYNEFKTKLEKQKKEEIVYDSWSEVTAIELEYTWLQTVIRLVEVVLKIVEIGYKLVDCLIEMMNTLNTLMNLFEAMENISMAQLPFDERYNDSISSVSSTLPSNNQPTSDPPSVKADKSIVTEQLDKAEPITIMKGFDRDSVDPDTNTNTISMYDAVRGLTNAISTWVVSFLAFVKLGPLGGLALAASLFILIERTLNVIEAFQEFNNQSCTIGDIFSYMYSKMLVADYAARMFPNRSTKIMDDSDLLGGDFKDCRDNWSSVMIIDRLDEHDDNFSLCRAEYVFGGTESERLNQTCVFTVLYGLRFAMNFLPVLLNEYVMKAVEACFDIPFVGWLIGILVLLSVVAEEAKIDVILMIAGSIKIPIIKLKCWLFTQEGLKDLTSNLKEIIENEWGQEKIEKCIDEYSKDIPASKTAPQKQDPTKTGNDQGYMKNHGIEFEFKLGYWNYTDYLFLFIMVKDEEKTLKRIADLIQLEMNAKAKKNGGTGYNLMDAATYFRITAEGNYDAILPVITIPGTNAFQFKKLYYAGY